MVATEPRLAIVWDEGYTLGRESRVRLWVLALFDPPRFDAQWHRAFGELIDDTLRPPPEGTIDARAKLLSHRAVAWFWPFGREEPHGHPPFYAIVGLIGDGIDSLLGHRWMPTWGNELSRARFGPMLAFSLAAGGIFGAFLRRWGVWPALAAWGSWTLHPHLFALGHYAGYDALLSSLWVGAILAFCRAVDPNATTRTAWTWTAAFGVLCGWALDTKLTGWFLPIPFVAWTLISQSRAGLRAVLVGGAVALVTLYAFNPPWWGEPIAGPIRFFESNLSRAKTIPIQTMFLGTVYRTPAESLPFYNTLVWTIFATPVGFLLLAILGSFRAVRDRASSDPLAVLAVVNWAFLLTLRALPHTPGHDGVRQFLPAFGCLALVAGLGAACAVEWWGRWGKALVGAAIVEGAVSVAVMMPVPLSYFSPIVGGLPGAAKLGMEPTYYWDALSRESLDRLDSITPRDRSVRFATFPTSWLYLKWTRAIRFHLFPVDRQPPAWYVVQNRPGEFDNVHRRLVRELGPKHVLVEKFGVPLVWAFPYDDAMRVLHPVAAPRGSP